MDRSLFPEGVETHQTALANTETTKAEQLLERFLDTGQGGVSTGMEVTVNVANTTLIDVAAGRGYAPGGEMTELLAGVTGVGLSNYGAGIDNFVCVVYTEVTSHPEAHAFDGTTRPTIATRSARVRVFTLSELNALVASSLDMSVDARDRALVMGIVNANGLAVPLTTADITLPMPTPTLLTAPLLEDLTGIEIVAISTGTSTTSERIAAGDSANSQGHLQLATNATPPGTATLAYRATGDAGFGVAQPIGAGGTFTIPSTTTSRTVQVRVTIELLPPTPVSTLTDSFNIDEMYIEDVMVAGARDEAHRRRAGTALATPLNAHGARIADLANVLEVPWSLILGTLLEDSLDKALVPRLLTPQVPSVLVDRTYIWEIALAVGLRVRFYVNQFSTLEVTVNARWQPSGTWIKDIDGATASKFSIFGSGIASFARAVGAGTWDDASWTSTPLFVSGLAGAASEGAINANGSVDLGALLLGSLAGRDVARVTNQYDNSGGAGQVRTLFFEQRRSGGLDDERVLRIYRANTAVLGSDAFEITINAFWDTAGNQWTKPAPAASAIKIEITRGFIVFYQRLAASATPFTDTDGVGGWDAPDITFSLALGNIVAGGDMYAANMHALASIDAVNDIDAGDNITAGDDITANGVTGFLATAAAAEYAYAIAHAGSQMIIPAQGAIQIGISSPLNPQLDGSILKVGVTSTAFAGWSISAPNGSTIRNFRIEGDFVVASGGWFVQAFRRARTGAAVVSLMLSGVVSLSGAVNSQIIINQNNVVNNQDFAYYINLFCSAIDDTAHVRFINFDWDSLILRP